MSPLLTLPHISRALTERPPRSLDLGITKRAAVAAVFRDGDDGAELLFIQRASQPHDPWSGQIAFPGGREEDVDRDLAATAIRETHEELGFDLTDAGRALGPLDPLQARSRRKITPLVIHPYAWVVEGEVPFPAVPNNEVDHAFWFPLRGLADPSRQIRYDALRTEVPYVFPGIDLGAERVLWGLTHRMVVEMGARLGFVDPESVDSLTMPRPIR
ncbi:MAG: CoA pyrophosphatase [Deltaproteobacteria bacterium]|nr:CoA pyrophosphatase [Deltaproteobacteria bacterium]